MESFDGFIAYIRGGGKPEAAEINALLRKYPWFTTAALLRWSVEDHSVENATAEPLLELHMANSPLPRPLLLETAAEEYNLRSERHIIESFLSKPEYRITPAEGTTDEDIAATENPAPDAIITEQLAEIYLAQGLLVQARSAYEKLSLVYPEKSVYFAEILADIEARINSGNNN